ncbi:hypothetical protein [Fervidibacillus halotolerans]|uniref:Uncharacterized protein n=1 Tax=Fervidibacillus halotolerans TaxID=2980027 RepID=A0A9E8RZJ7_9BACI|nr:hypothetical protein [Fervidibacillus halotolerans]WAA13214.1 hypothetical protein OE105_03560 [Fervidibacillus halotolerans]
MDEKTAREWIEKLASGQWSECRVEKNDFLVFRSVLTKRADFKHFHGSAQRGGAVIFTYLKEPRN